MYLSIAEDHEINKILNNFDVTKIVIFFMEKYEKKKNLSGGDKKRLVLKRIRDAIVKRFGEEKYSNYEIAIEITIEFIITISKNKKLLDGINKHTRKCFPCVYSLLK